MWESILSNILSQAPWTAIIVLVIYFGYREFKHSNEELKEADRRIYEEFKEADRRIYEELKEIDKKAYEELKEADKRIIEEMRVSEERIMRRIDRVLVASVNIQEATWGLLAQKSVITSGEAAYLKMISDGISKLALLNPISKEEWARMEALHDKDIAEITHAEAMELYDFARRVIDEFGEHLEAWHFFNYAVVIKYMTLKREIEEKKEKGEKKESE